MVQTQGLGTLELKGCAPESCPPHTRLPCLLVPTLAH